MMGRCSCSANSSLDLEDDVTAGALAISHNFAPRLAAAMVSYGLLLSLLTLPLWAGVAAA